MVCVYVLNNPEKVFQFFFGFWGVFYLISFYLIKKVFKGGIPLREGILKHDRYLIIPLISDLPLNIARLQGIKKLDIIKFFNG